MEIYRFDGSTETFDPAKVTPTIGASSITVLDLTTTDEKAFYRFRAIAPE